ncbi:Protein angel 2 [Mortierella polycephala]|uniref:Protein angel 2 n=1 Tax=Mortierella polycephala TaxID=41804 RepID=A0A9P6U0X3_9FUNG|nr:Protein angel 2 [Mortierella polycephala]
MTYNLLAKSLAQSNSYLYTYCGEHVMQWKNRSRVLLAELESHLLDVYCLQELDSDDYHDLFQPTFLKWGYTGFFKKRNGEKMDGCAMFYRNKSVKAVSIHGVDYNLNHFMNRDNVGIVAILDIKQGNETKRVCVATTHILFNPKRGMIKIAQLCILLQEAKNLIEREECEVPIVLCGDLNSLPHSTIIQYLLSDHVNVSLMPDAYLSGQTPGIPRSGTYKNTIAEFHNTFLGRSSNSSIVSSTATTESSVALIDIAGSNTVIHDNQSLEIKTLTRRFKNAKFGPLNEDPILSQPFLLKSAYDIDTVPNKTGGTWARSGQSWTTHHGHCKQTCDYIFYGYLRSLMPSSSSISQSPQPMLHVASCLELPCGLIQDQKGLPTADFGSDHLSLVTKFRFE